VGISVIVNNNADNQMDRLRCLSRLLDDEVHCSVTS
jgi:hypothetical protein